MHVIHRGSRGLEGCIVSLRLWVTGLIPWTGGEVLADVPLSKALNPTFAPWAPDMAGPLCS